MLKLVFLLGHRKQMGKDTTCDLAETILNKNNISFIRTSFADKLKRHCAERYELNLAKMEFDVYKKSKPTHLNGLSVRDVLIKEGTFARQIWSDVWTSSTFFNIFTSGATVGLISDFRYPNEFNSFEATYLRWSKRNNLHNNPLPKVVKVLAHRPGGPFNSDGSDDQLPDLDPNYWDEVILNSVEDIGWHENMERQVQPMIQRNLDKYVLNSFKGS